MKTKIRKSEISSIEYFYSRENESPHIIFYNKEKEIIGSRVFETDEELNLYIASTFADFLDSN